jgi:hypothetical protein
MCAMLFLMLVLLGPWQRRGNFALGASLALRHVVVLLCLTGCPYEQKRGTLEAATCVSPHALPSAEEVGVTLFAAIHSTVLAR